MPGSWSAMASYAPVLTVSAANPQNNTTLTSCSRCGPSPGRSGVRSRPYSSRPSGRKSQAGADEHWRTRTKTAIGMKPWPRVLYHVATDTKIVSDRIKLCRVSRNQPAELIAGGIGHGQGQGERDDGHNGDHQS